MKPGSYSERKTKQTSWKDLKFGFCTKNEINENIKLRDGDECHVSEEH